MNLKEIREALQPLEIITTDQDGNEVRITAPADIRFKDVAELLPRLQDIQRMPLEQREAPLKQLVEDTCKRVKMDAAIPHILDLPENAQLVVIDGFFGCLKYGLAKNRGN
jgi:hypothetical protein